MKKKTSNSEFQIFWRQMSFSLTESPWLQGTWPRKQSDLDLGNSGLGENKAIPLLKILKQTQDRYLVNVVTSNGPSLSVKPQTRRIGDDMQGKEKN